MVNQMQHQDKASKPGLAPKNGTYGSSSQQQTTRQNAH